MGKTIDFIMGSVLAVALAGCGETIYAKRDYDVYPAHKAEIAMYNMREIAKSICGSAVLATYPNCGSMTFDEQGLTYVEMICRATEIGSGRCVSEGSVTYRINWDQIRKIVPSKSSVRVCTADRNCVNISNFGWGTWGNLKQAQDFAEAMNVYVQK